MPCVCYVHKKFGKFSHAVIEIANAIIAEYAEKGYALTLRQLYYQFVARNVLPNTERSYKRLGAIINDARLAGLVDWSAIEDRTRMLRGRSHWDSPQDIVSACARQFAMDKWESQLTRVEVWVEKDALLGVVERVALDLDVPYFSCRGYVSQSELWGAAQRIVRHTEDAGQDVVVLHLGDHDPSGVDMTRDIQARFETFGARARVQRIALNQDQIDAYEPPPNPAKITDSRAAGYISTHGEDSWELDALEPTVLAALIEHHVKAHRDDDLWNEAVAKEKEGARDLALVHKQWDRAVRHCRVNEARRTGRGTKENRR